LAVQVTDYPSLIDDIEDVPDTSGPLTIANGTRSGTRRLHRLIDRLFARHFDELPTKLLF
jgi:hypothetical protein